MIKLENTNEQGMDTGMQTGCCRDHRICNVEAYRITNTMVLGSLYDHGVGYRKVMLIII